MVKTTVQIEWKNGPVKGCIEVANGEFVAGKVLKGKGVFTADKFVWKGEGPCRVSLTIESKKLSVGAFSPMVTVRAVTNPFTFYLRDVREDYPICLPAYGVVVLTDSDKRSYDEIADKIGKRGLQNALDRYESEPEESFENAAANTRSVVCPTWLGVARDNRIFHFEFYREGMRDNLILPKFRDGSVTEDELEGKPLKLYFLVGRGIGCKEIISRSLDSDSLPILRGKFSDDEVQYDCIVFGSLEKKKLTAENVRGTDAIYADSRSHGHHFIPENQVHLDEATKIEENLNEETVLCVQAKATNLGNVPRYAFFKTATFYFFARPDVTYDADTGFGSYKTGRVFVVSKMNGQPMPQEEMSVLLAPGETATMEFYVPHSPISKARASKLAKQDFEKKLSDCRTYWQQKLASYPQINVPEKNINAMIRANMLHLEMAMYGKEPDGPVTPTVGVYSAIGSESSPIIQAHDSFGSTELAQRSIQFFIDIQQDNGFIQNYQNYMLETGAILWTIGEHYRYTRDDKWARKIKPNLIKACDYLIAWRKRNMKEEFRGKGYGMMDGKVADPEDPYHIYMLNGYSYIGLKRIAEMFETIDPAQSKRIKREANALKNDIKNAFYESLAKGPAVPLGDGSWIPTASSWAENQGPLCLFSQGDTIATHGAFVTRDSLVGPIYLCLQEVLETDLQAADFLINFQSDLLCMRNVTFSQPYYSSHPWLHLKRGEVKSFLKFYFNAVTSLADRETYTFWEHFFQASPHKTHEVGWFLTQTRWMLWMEEYEARNLKLLAGVPRDWLADGKRIELDGVASYFGKLSLRVLSNLADGEIKAVIECKAKDRSLDSVEIRLPHPLGRKAISAKGGVYNAEKECVRIDKFNGKASITLSF